MPGVDVQLHPADGDAPRRGRLRREGRRGREGVRRRTRRRSSGSASRCAASWRRSAAPPTCRSRCSRAPPRCRSTSTATRIARYGLNVADVRELVETAIGGTRRPPRSSTGRAASTCVVRFPDEVRGDPERARRAAADGPARRAGAARRRRRHPHRPRRRRPSTTRTAERRLVVQTNVRGRDVGSFVAEAQQRPSAAREAAGRLLRHVGRAVREPAARDAAPRARHSRSRW